jgi:hypothetical protein
MKEGILCDSSAVAVKAKLAGKNAKKIKIW